MNVSPFGRADGNGGSGDGGLVAAGRGSVSPARRRVRRGQPMYVQLSEALSLRTPTFNWRASPG